MRSRRGPVADGRPWRKRAGGQWTQRLCRKRSWPAERCRAARPGCYGKAHARCGQTRPRRRRSRRGRRNCASRFLHSQPQLRRNDAAGGPRRQRGGRTRNRGRRPRGRNGSRCCGGRPGGTRRSSASRRRRRRGCRGGAQDRGRRRWLHWGSRRDRDRRGLGGRSLRVRRRRGLHRCRSLRRSRRPRRRRSVGGCCLGGHDGPLRRRGRRGRRSSRRDRRA